MPAGIIEMVTEAQLDLGCAISGCGGVRIFVCRGSRGCGCSSWPAARHDNQARGADIGRHCQDGALDRGASRCFEG